MKKHSFIYRNSLTIAFVAIMLITLGAQAFTGWCQFNAEMEEKGQPEIAFPPYLVSPHFLEATFENWESEFLQMGMYVLLTVWLRQKGSAESKSLDEKEEVDREPKPSKDAPWAVNKGGFWLTLYRNSLSIAFFALFLFSFVIHFVGSHAHYNLEQQIKGEPGEAALEYLLNSKFWFESFQNWQSEFLSVASIVFLSIYLRQWGSPESKPVDAPHSETGK
jgi:Trk-type K+ transport system membrane component